MSIKTLEEFIEIERNRFTNRHNNMFAKSFGEINRYYFFLTVIKKRHSELVKRYFKIFKQFQNTIIKIPGSHPFTDEQMKLDREITHLSNLIHLEVESFYLFAKILLDKIATSILFYFGKDKEVNIKTHHSMVEKLKDGTILKIEAYVNRKNISLNNDLLSEMIKIQQEVSCFRDDYITHLQCPRTVRGTFVDGRIIFSRIYPKNEKEKHSVIPKSLDELLVLIKRYINFFITFLKKNSNKTALETKETK